MQEIATLNGEDDSAFKRILLNLALGDTPLHEICKQFSLTSEQATNLIEEAAQAELDFYNVISLPRDVLRINTYIAKLEQRMNGKEAIAAVSKATELIQIRRNIVDRAVKTGQLNEEPSVSLVIDGICVDDLR